MFVKFAVDTKLRGPINALRGMSAVLSNLDMLEKWKDRHFMKSNKDKCKVPYLARGSSAVSVLGDFK